MSRTKTRALIGFAAIAGIPLLLLGDTSAAFLRGWSTPSRLDWLLMFALLLAIGLVCFGTVNDRGRSLLSRRSPQLLICTVAVVCTWLTAEYLTYVLVAPASRGSFHLRSPKSVTVFRPAPGVMPGVNGESRFTVNSVGVRGPDLPSRSAANRILCIGGSTTECLYLDDSEGWPYLVMEILNRRTNAKPLWVGNLGISGFSTADHLKFLSENSLWKEMDCLLFMVGANDLGKFLRFGITMKSPSDMFWDRDQEFQSLEPIWKKSILLETVRDTYQQWNVPQLLIEDEAGANYAVRRKMRQSASLREDMPDLTAALDQYEYRTTRIIELCESVAVRPVLLTQPSLYGDHVSEEVRSMFWSGDDGQGGYFCVEALGSGLDQYNERLKSVCAEQHVQCIDLDAMNSRPELFYDEYHFNEAGAREIARLVAQSLANLTL